jgi:hypothetical protein
VTATLADWMVICDDPKFPAQLEELKPERLGYLPFQEREWAELAERFLLARVVSMEPPSSEGPKIPGGGFTGRWHRIAGTSGALQSGSGTPALASRRHTDGCREKPPSGSGIEP